MLSKYSDGLLDAAAPPCVCTYAADPPPNAPFSICEFKDMQGVSSILNGDLKSKLAMTFLMKKLTGPWKHENAIKHFGQLAFCALSMRKLFSSELMYFLIVISVKLLATNLSFYAEKS